MKLKGVISHLSILHPSLDDLLTAVRRKRRRDWAGGVGSRFGHAPVFIAERQQLRNKL